ncbi:hypothetical protein M406DRAFT_62998 [Cryphonectria parasitica EP155]|uniref:Uncharacterized protein n=1 Tax=Cryphonectria parasitica (strain ATCC 38755 / EP155) TaxID=660469 RepID=A0A9P4Y9K4_CRYP1|nr:uncharacterized protein M406DRAFT_62998 [Cryphonectria parasitica EP155]KAF3769016.1 hypothetical protein M406DRAFT_62998 [Cryphonectria parasitica EP155]
MKIRLREYNNSNSLPLLREQKNIKEKGRNNKYIGDIMNNAQTLQTPVTLKTNPVTQFHVKKPPASEHRRRMDQ